MIPTVYLKELAPFEDHPAHIHLRNIHLGHMKAYGRVSMSTEGSYQLGLHTTKALHCDRYEERIRETIQM